MGVATGTCGWKPEMLPNTLQGPQHPNENPPALDVSSAEDQETATDQQSPLSGSRMWTEAAALSFYTQGLAQCGCLVFTHRWEMSGRMGRSVVSVSEDCSAAPLAQD